MTKAKPAQLPAAEREAALAPLINKIYNEDCMGLLERMPSETVDLVIADPPYFHVCGDFDFTFKNRADYLDWCRLWLMECRRVLTPKGTLILWGGVGKNQITLARLAVMIEDEALFERQNWVTQQNTRGIGTKRNYMSCREEFLFLTKSEEYAFNVPYTEERTNRKDLGANGKPRKSEFKRVSNVWSDITEASQSSAERCGHPTVKAQKLCDRLTQTHSNPGDVVFIPFVGSGSEVISAVNNARRFVGSESDLGYFDLAVSRIHKFTGTLAGQ